MRKIIGILIISVWAMVSFAQTKPTEVSPNDYMRNATYEYVWGTSLDTLTNADTLAFVYRVMGVNTMDINVGLYSDFVSGAAGGTLIGYYSYDGVNYFSLGDTITVSSLTADAFDSEQLDYADYNYPYLKLIYLQTGTAVTIPRAYIYAKFN